MQEGVTTTTTTSEGRAGGAARGLVPAAAREGRPGCLRGDGHIAADYATGNRQFTHADLAL